MVRFVAIGLAALAFAAWAVYLVGLASLQDKCETNDGVSRLDFGVSPSTPCSKVYRYYWFVAAWEFVTVVALNVSAVLDKLDHLRLAFVGLFAVGTMLYIDAANVFLTAESNDFYDSGSPQKRMRITTAGAIMAALLNATIVVAVGAKAEVATATKSPTVATGCLATKADTGAAAV